ncbi:MAG: YwaF family protein [Clostridia bacterium]|nr:YwaF family protein [Clostridia bacterium]
MNFWVKLQQICETEMPRPGNYGWFHLLFFALSIIVGILLCVTHKKGDDARVRRAVFITGVLVIFLEVFKMFVYSFYIEDNKLIWDFQWYAFPWQFCSTPMYVSILTGIFRKGKVHKSLMAYLATYALFAGLCVMFYPNDVFIGEIGVNVQTMICHGSMLTIAIYLYGSGYVKTEHKTILRAIPVFAAAVGIAALLNEVMFHSGIIGDETFNMFFISPHFEGTLPVYSSVQAVVPFPWCLIIYILAFSAASYIMLLGAWGIKKLIKRKKV